MRRFVKLSCFLLLAIALCAATWAQSNRRPPNKRPPQRWDKRVLDVFFADIRREVGPGEPGSAPRVGPGTAVAATSNGSTATGDAASGFAWSGLISRETLEDEIKSTALRLEETVENPGRFKSGRHNDARRLYSVAAVTFAVISEYDQDVRFKENAAGLRDAMARAGGNCKVNTDAAYTEARSRFEQLQEIVRGANVEIAAPEEPTPYSEVAEYGPIMQRMEVGFLETVKPGVSSGEEFRDRQEDLLHEAEMLSVFARFIRDESYGYALDETFKGLTDELEAQSQALAAAVKANDLNAAQAAVGAIDQSCTKCHGDFR